MFLTHATRYLTGQSDLVIYVRGRPLITSSLGGVKMLDFLMTVDDGRGKGGKAIFVMT